MNAEKHRYLRLFLGILSLFLLSNFAHAQNNDAYLNYLANLVQKEQYEKALLSLDSAIGKSPQTLDFYYAKSGVFQGMGRFFDALNILSVCLKNNPDAIDAHIERGNIFDMIFEFDAAIVEYEQAVKKAKDDQSRSFAYSNLGGAKMKKREFADAYNILKKAVELNENNIDALSNLAASCDEVGKKEEALIYLEKIIKINPKYVPAYANLGFYYQKENNHKKAVEYFNKAIELDPKESYAYNNRGYSYLQLGNLDAAATDIEKAIELNVINAYAYRNRALLHLKKNNIPAMCADIETGLKFKFTEMYGQELEELKSKHCK